MVYLNNSKMHDAISFKTKQHQQYECVHNVYMCTQCVNNVYTGYKGPTKWEILNYEIIWVIWAPGLFHFLFHIWTFRICFDRLVICLVLYMFNFVHSFIFWHRMPSLSFRFSPYPLGVCLIVFRVFSSHSFLSRFVVDR